MRSISVFFDIAKFADEEMLMSAELKMCVA